MLELLQSILGEEALLTFYEGRHMLVLLGVIALLLAALGKAADVLVGEAAVLSERSGLPKVVIGATIISLGTTSPEAAVSVLAAVRGDPGLALGNAVGSIICDTGLILGVACLISPPVLHRQIVNRQGWVQVAAGVLLVAACWPLVGGSPFHLEAFTTGGNLPQQAGFLFVGLLALYLWLSARWARGARRDGIAAEVREIEEETGDVGAPVAVVLAKLLAAVGLVVLTSHLLIPAISVAAERMGVPSAILAASLVAFGTSLPELVTAVTASLRGHGDLAVGNIIGADILNVLFVAGLSAAVSPGGLTAPPEFFQVLFPAMLGVLLVFRVGIFVSGERLGRRFGVILLIVYVAAMLLSYSALAQ